MLTPEFTREDYEKTARAIRERIHVQPTVALILGSGLGPLADSIEDATIIPYTDLPNWPRSTVAGHHGRLVTGKLENVDVIAMQGRAHYYEGYSMAQVGFPIRVFQVMGIKTLIVTNAAGGLNQSFDAGDLMLIVDHINLIGHMGLTPLYGPNDESFGPRFPIFTRAYDKHLGDMARKVAAANGITLREGIYICLAGPAFETPADIRMLRQWGADAVGMSTVPEVVTAVHGGMRVLGISSITNIAIDDPASDKEVSHEEVLATGKIIVPRLMTMLRGVLQQL
ncbi:MAG: purine-nucleoside phosphorylase [Chloroflexi bacterium]|nr:purine-nucleoside phosphorylase [Chloroflexota bacterium]